MEEHPLSPFLVEICSPLFTQFSGFDCAKHINKYHTLRVSLALLVNVYHAIVFVYEVGQNSIPNPQILGYFSVRYRRVFIYLFSRIVHRLIIRDSQRGGQIVSSPFFPYLFLFFLFSLSPRPDSFLRFVPVGTVLEYSSYHCEHICRPNRAPSCLVCSFSHLFTLKCTPSQVRPASHPCQT